MSSDNEEDQKEATLKLCIDALLSFQNDVKKAAEQEAPMAKVHETGNDFEARVKSSLPLLEDDQAKLLTSFLEAVRHADAKDNKVIMVKDHVKIPHLFLKDKLLMLVDHLTECFIDIGIRLKDGPNGVEWDHVDAKTFREQRDHKVHVNAKVRAEELRAMKNTKWKILKEAEIKALNENDKEKLEELQDQLHHLENNLAWIDD